MESFYGITTTTLVVLSAFSIAFFTYFAEYLQKQIKAIDEGLIDNKKYKIFSDNKYKELNDKYKELNGNNYNGDQQNSTENKEYEEKYNYGSLKSELKSEINESGIIYILITLLAAVVLCASISVLLTLANGINILSKTIAYEIIMCINFVAIVLYIITFISSFLSLAFKRNKLNKLKVKARTITTGDEHIKFGLDTHVYKSAE